MSRSSQASLAFSLCALLLLGACAGSEKIATRPGYNREIGTWGHRVRGHIETKDIGKVINGEISWYGPGFHGKKTASGEIYNQNALTCAHKSLPFGTHLRIELQKTGKSVVVRVNDRGPYVGKRVVDVSRRAAEKLGLKKIGVGQAKITILK